jgi:hypothetical protein
VELATFAASHDVLGISDRCGPVEALSERTSDDRSGGNVVATRPRVAVLQQLAPLIREDAVHEYSSRTLLVKIPIDEPEGFGPSHEASGLGAVAQEFPLHHPLQDWDPLVGVL